MPSGSTTTTNDDDANDGEHKRRRVRRGTGSRGGAAGPDWTRRLHQNQSSKGRRFRLRVRTDASLTRVERATRGGADDSKRTRGPYVAVLGDGERIEMDVLVSAVGVDPAPRVQWLPEGSFPRGADGGVAVDRAFRTMGPHGHDVYAAGDCASCELREGRSKGLLAEKDGISTAAVPWFQMRLWSQARTSGTFVARVMCGECDDDAWGFNYELFVHSTSFFGARCVFLGLYNGQLLDNVDEKDVTTYSRRGDGSFARVLLVRGVMRGAVLIGDVESAETFENLILDGIDLSRFGPTLLDPEVDIDDYFD